MMLLEPLHTSGDHALQLTAQAGRVEASLLVPEGYDYQTIALLGHPHSLQGGTMQNKVVTTLARLFKDLGIASLRFNFRGVGQSDGVYDAGIGESIDMLELARQCRVMLPDVRLCFAGFSFGSYVAYRAAAQTQSALLLTIAPPVHHYDYATWSPRPSPWLVVQGDDDEVVPLADVLRFAEQQQLSVMRLAKTGHFFHGQLLALKERLLPEIKRVLSCN